MAVNFSRDNGPTLIKDSDFHKDIPIEVEDIPIEVPKEEFDYQRKLQEMLNNAQQQGAESSVDLKISEIDFGESFEGLVQLNRVEELLAQAKALINDKKFTEAIDRLDEILAIDANVHEAVYLKGHCLAGLGEFYQALEIIFPLRAVNLSQQLPALLENLRTTIRNGLFLHVLLISVADEQGGQNGRLIDYMERLIDLDPEMGLYYFLLSGGLMRRGRGEDALLVLDDGLRMDATGMTDLLSGFRFQIQQAVMGEKLQPAVAAFKKGHYRQARNALKPVMERFRNNEMVAVFDEYLKVLDPGLLGFMSKKHDELPPPLGDEDTVLSLYQLIVKEEIDLAMQWLQAGRPDASIAMLLQGRAYTPRYPLINFMLGGLIYRFSEHLLTSGQKNIDQTYDLVRQAQVYAKLGVLDASNEEAPRLLNAIGQLLQVLDALRQALRRRNEEIQIGNRLIGEFQEIMNEAQGGIKSVQQLDALASRLVRLNNELQDVLPDITQEDIKQPLDQLDEAIQRNLGEVDNIREQIAQSHDVETVNSHYNTFKTMMDALNSGNVKITTREQLEGLISTFEFMKDSVERDRHKVTSREAREALDNLVPAIQNVLSQLRGY